MTPAAVLAIAMQCLSPNMAPIAAGMALHENPRLDEYSINWNTNGTRDFGLAQINETNFAMLSRVFKRPVNAKTILDPCLNLQASIYILFVRYNGKPPPLVAAKYAAGASVSIGRMESLASGQPFVPQVATGPPKPMPQENPVIYDLMQVTQETR